MNAAFLCQIEQLLSLYALPYQQAYPVVCFDERPCFLIGDVVEPTALQTGQVAKWHYAYEKNGSCCLLTAIEPLTGQRLAQVHAQRTKKEYTLFMQELAAQYPAASKIRLVQDNLNTPNFSSFYEHLPADQAQQLAQRFELYYTPKSASWLNRIEPGGRSHRIFGHSQAMSKSTHSHPRPTGKGSVSHCPRTPSKADQNRLAILPR